MESIKKTANLAFHFFRVMRNDKILFVLVFFGAFLILMSGVLADFSYTDSQRFILDFGLAGISLSLNLAAIIGGCILIPREIEKKTIYMILCRPVKRWVFLVGAFLGGSLLLLLIMAVMTAILIVFCYLNGINDPLQILKTGILEYFKAEIMLSLALFFSTFTIPSISIMSTLALFLVGYSTKTISAFMKKSDSIVLDWLAELLYRLIPNLSLFEAKHMVTHTVLIPKKMFLFASGYCFFYCVVVILISIPLFARKEIN